MMRVAVVQMVSGNVLEANLSQAETLIQAASAGGAEVVVLPENFALYGKRNLCLEAEEEDRGTGPILPFLAATAKRARVSLVGGTVPFTRGVNGQVAPPGKVFAGCTLWSPEGEMLGRYDKAHLFDVSVDDGMCYRESDTLVAGQTPVTVTMPWGGLGLSVCYDLRFPEFYRCLLQEGATVIAVPSAFVKQTGAAHWEVLLRARAIENQCFVLAANQGGDHGRGRLTWGHSCVVDPWGNVLVMAEADGPGVFFADLDWQRLHEVRSRMPIQSHRRF